MKIGVLVFRSVSNSNWRLFVRVDANGRNARTLRIIEGYKAGIREGSTVATMQRFEIQYPAPDPPRRAP